MNLAPARVYLISNTLLAACRRGWWVALAVRLAVELQLDAVQLVLLGTAMELTILVSEVPTGVVADVFSRKRSVIIGFVVVGAAQLAAGLVDTFPALVLTQVLWGFGWTFISGAFTAWVTDEVGSAEAVEPLVLRTARLQFVATIAGIGVSAGLGHFVSLEVAIVVSGVLVLVWGLALIAVMPEHAFSPERDAGLAGARRASADVLRHGRATVLTSTGLRVLLWVVLVSSLAAETVDRLDVRRLDDVGLSSELSAIGVFASISVGQAILAAIFLWRLEQRLQGPLVVPAMAAIIGVVALLTLVIAQVPVLAVVALARVFQGGLMDVSDPLRVTWTNAFASGASRATVHSFVGQSLAFGEIAGGVALGTVAQVITVPTAMTISAALFALGAAMAVRGRPAFTTSAAAG